jgi:CelD/BcsL family acetyltransferase involved in cellulose biosynthesis
MSADLIAETEGLEEIAGEWDDLAVLAGEPMATPAWMLGWLRFVAPADVEPRVVAVRDGKRLVALAPFYVRADRPGHYRLMADDFSSSVALLAQPERAWEAAQVVAEVLAAAPRPPARLDLSPLSSLSPWPRAMQESWPGRWPPALHETRCEDAATASLHGSFDDYMANRGSEFRRTVRRRLRALEADGGSMRISTAATVKEDIATFIRLHESRWNERGDSRLLQLGPRLQPLLEAMAHQLVESARFRLWLVEVDGKPICADLSLVAGGEIVGINTGWDEEYKKLAPAQIVTIRKIEDAYERGETRIDMGWGSLDYKRAFCDGTDPIRWYSLIPPGSRWALERTAAVGPALRHRTRQAAGRHLDPARVARLRKLAAKVRPGGSPRS